MTAVSKPQQAPRLLVQKFGGTSVGSIERINHVADLVAEAKAKGNKLVIVLSAMSGETNRLLKLGKALNANGSAEHFDLLVTTGEQVTIALLAIALDKRGIAATPYCGWQVPIQTDSHSGKARITDIDIERISANLETDHVVIVAGFQGVSDAGRVTTLGRGGSDTTAVALAAALKADECQIFTDVDGVYTTDPRIVPTASRLAEITFEEMLELASLGSKVLQIRSVEFAGKYGVPLRVLSSFTPGPGTLITFDKGASMEDPVVSGIALERNEAKLTVRGVPDIPGAAYQILGPIGEANVVVDMIVQNVAADNTTDFTFTVPKSDVDKAEALLQKQAKSLGAREVFADAQIAKISVVGIGMRSHASIASVMFQVLAKEGINILMISTSEIKISVVIHDKYAELAVRALHEAFDLAQSA